ETALRHCAKMFGGEAAVEARAEQPPRPRTSLPGTSAPSEAAVPPPMRQQRESTKLDTVSLDLIENALRNARHEMDAVLFRSAMSPVIREQHDEFPMICLPDGRMVVGQF